MKDLRSSRLAGLSFVTLMVLACSDSVEPITAPTEASTDRSAAEAARSADAERVALARIGKVIAMSLGEKSARHELKKELRAAPFREHKLELSAYVRSENGKKLLARAAGKSDEVLTLLDQVRPLEFYMPVRKHRETWVGDEEVLVAVQLEEEDPIFAFNARGEAIRLDSDTPPDQPMLSIVPSETRFDRPMPSNSRNLGDLDGNAIGTLSSSNLQINSVIAIGDDGGGGGGGGGSTSVPPGVYLEFSRILDVHEPITKGEPEIEVHIHGPSDQGDPRAGKDLSCSGAQAYDSRKAFDQNGGFWEGRAMLFSGDEVARYNSQFSDGFHVLFWEDDDTSCVLKLDNEALLELLKSTAGAYSAVALKVVPFTWRLAAGVFIATFFTNPGEWLKTNDDFVGAAVPLENTGYYYPANTHVLMEGTNLNGRLTIVNR